MNKYESGGAKKKIKSFTDLDAYKEAHKLVLMIYKVTKNFPREERYSLTDQMGEQLYLLPLI